MTRMFYSIFIAYLTVISYNYLYWRIRKCSRSKLKVFFFYAYKQPQTRMAKDAVFKSSSLRVVLFELQSSIVA